VLRRAAPQGEFEKAAQLYRGAGRLRRAVDMCFECRLFDVLRSIAEELPPGADPELVGAWLAGWLAQGYRG
jgi:hypothetical protein